MLFAVGLSLFVSSCAFGNTLLNQNFTARNYPYITCSWALQSKSGEEGWGGGGAMKGQASESVLGCVYRERLKLCPTA